MDDDDIVPGAVAVTPRMQLAGQIGQRTLRLTRDAVFRATTYSGPMWGGHSPEPPMGVPILTSATRRRR